MDEDKPLDDQDENDDTKEECKVDEDKSLENDQEELLQHPDEIEEIVQRSIAISSKKALEQDQQAHSEENLDASGFSPGLCKATGPSNPHEPARLRLDCTGPHCA